MGVLARLGRRGLDGPAVRCGGVPASGPADTPAHTQMTVGAYGESGVGR